jgi:hypothetical protein
VTSDPHILCNISFDSKNDEFLEEFGSQTQQLGDLYAILSTVGIGPELDRKLSLLNLEVWLRQSGFAWCACHALLLLVQCISFLEALLINFRALHLQLPFLYSLS